MVLDAYRDAGGVIDPGFARRRELWRLFGYLAVVAVDGAQPFGRSNLARIEQIVEA